MEIWAELKGWSGDGNNVNIDLMHEILHSFLKIKNKIVYIKKQIPKYSLAEYLCCAILRINEIQFKHSLISRWRKHLYNIYTSCAICFI